MFFDVVLELSEANIAFRKAVAPFAKPEMKHHFGGKT